MRETDAQFLNRMMDRESDDRRRRVQAALYRAREHGGAKAAKPIANGEFRVIGVNGTYFVTAFGGDAYRSTCPAGTHGRPCWHQAASWLRSIADKAVAA
jgi:hypothetical protein